MDIDVNRQTWDGAYDWSGQGEEWSRAWGGSEAQWYGCIFPRIHHFLPVESILEIAPGYGRWTQYLLRYSRTLIAVDLSAKCIEACRTRFVGAPALFFVNDGSSLAMVADGTIDLAFSFDSLVHAEAAVIRDYIFELSEKLSVNGVAFIHHSNFGSYAMAGVGNPHLRAPSMTADALLNFCAESGRVTCISQELINWGQAEMIDCISTITPIASRYARPSKRIENSWFMTEAAIIRQYSGLYAADQSS